MRDGILNNLRALRLACCCVLVAAGTMLALGGSAAAAAELTEDVWYKDGHVERWRIAGDWTFAKDELDVGAQGGWAGHIPDVATHVQVPHVWNADLTKASFQGAVGWYFARFRAPHAGRFRVRFLSSHHTVQAYMDGAPIGSHQGGFLAWETSPVSLSAGEHLLAVRADTRKETTVAQTGGEGWWNWGGLSREVELRKARDLDVVAVRAGTTALGRRSAVQRVVVRVANATDRPVTGRVRITLAGQSLVSSGLALAGEEQREVAFRVRVNRPRRWSTARPSLYRLDVFTGTDAGESRAWTGMVGIRRLIARNGTIRLNGRRFFARGVALHDQARNVGSALTPEDLRANFKLVRGLHANMVRAHYPLHPAFLEMLDRAGIVSWAEAPVLWLSNDKLGRPEVRKTVLGYLRETIDGQGWHATAGIWSAGNELAITERQGPGMIGYVKEAKRLTRALDPTRPFALAFQSRFSFEYRPFCNLVDVFGLNYYLGWYWGPKPGRHHRRALRTQVAVCPRRPWIVTEFGAEAGSAGSRHKRGSYGYQSALISSTLRALQRMRQVDGAMIWAGRDFAVDPLWDGGNKLRPNPPLNQKGLVTLSGRKKPAYRITASLFRRLAGR
jgi:beta-glucuronidase